MPTMAEPSLEMPQPTSISMSRSRVTAAAKLRRSKTAQAIPAAQPSPNQMSVLAGQRQREKSQPRIGNQGLERRPRRSQRVGEARPSGAAPAPSAVAFAQLVESADRMIAPIEALQRPSTAKKGAQLTLGNQSAVQAAPEFRNEYLTIRYRSQSHVGGPLGFLM